MNFYTARYVDRRVMRLERRIARDQRRLLRHQLRMRRHQHRLFKHQQRLQSILGRTFGPGGTFAPSGMFGPPRVCGLRGMFGSGFGYGSMRQWRHSGNIWRRRPRRLFAILLGLLLVGIATAMMSSKGERPGNWVSV